MEVASEESTDAKKAASEVIGLLMRVVGMQTTELEVLSGFSSRSKNWKRLNASKNQMKMLKIMNTACQSILNG